MGTLNENEEYREQTDKLFIPHSACGFHVLSLDTDAKGKRGVPPPLLAAGVSRAQSARDPKIAPADQSITDAFADGAWAGCWPNTAFRWTKMSLRCSRRRWCSAIHRLGQTAGMRKGGNAALPTRPAGCQLRAGRSLQYRQLPHLIVTLAPRPDQIGVEFAHSTSSTTMLRIASRSSAGSVSMKPFASANRTMP